MDAPRFRGEILAHVLGVEQDGVDHLLNDATRLDGRRLRLLRGRLGFRAPDFRRKQLLDAGIAAHRAREQPAGLLTLEILRGGEPTLEAVAMCADELEDDHVGSVRKSLW